MAIEWLLSGYGVAMGWLSNGNPGVKQLVQISVYDGFGGEVSVRSRLRDALSVFCNAFKDIECAFTPPPRASSHYPEAQASVSKTICAYGPLPNQNMQNAFALRLMDEILHHFAPSHAFILCSPLHPLALILVVFIY